MLLLLGAFVAGVLTTLAPCVLPLLPVIVGGSVTTPEQPSHGGGAAVATRRTTDVRRALIVTASLGVSVIVFTLLLKVSTALLGIPTHVWSWLAGGLLILLGFVGLFPSQWERISTSLRLQGRSGSALNSARERDGTLGAVLTGAALGPVFTSCSPLYGYVIVTVLPAEPVRGLVLLLAYAFGLCVTLLAVALLGQRLIRRLGWAVDPHAKFRRVLGAVFIAVGLLVATGADKSVQTWILQNSPVQPWNLDTSFVPEG